MKGLPKSGQWFRLRNSHWDTAFLAKRIVQMPGTRADGGYFVDEDFLQALICKQGSRPIPTYIPIGCNVFEIITDPEEEAMLCLAYLGV